MPRWRWTGPTWWSSRMSRRGCAASLRVALALGHPRATGIVLMLGDQPPGGAGDTAAGHRPRAGHEMHGDAAADGASGIHSGLPHRVRRSSRDCTATRGCLSWPPAATQCRELRRPDGCVPLVDTWDDYRRLLNPRCLVRPSRSPDDVIRRFGEPLPAGYRHGVGLLGRLRWAGAVVGKVSRSVGRQQPRKPLAVVLNTTLIMLQCYEG